MFTKQMINKKKMLIQPMFLKTASTSAGSVGAQKKREMQTMSRMMSLIHWFPHVSVLEQWAWFTLNVCEDGLRLKGKRKCMDFS